MRTDRLTSFSYIGGLAQILRQRIGVVDACHQRDRLVVCRQFIQIQAVLFHAQRVFDVVLQEQQLPFVSRGDDSGTDKKEKKIWKGLELDPTQNPNYLESGQGMGATLTMANEKEAYCLTDRGTWLKQSIDSENNYTIDIVCEGGKELLNQYGVIAVNPDKFPDVNNDAANQFIDWITSDDVQQLIGEFGIDKYGQALFTPNAGTDN